MEKVGGGVDNETRRAGGYTYTAVQQDSCHSQLAENIEQASTILSIAWHK